MPNYQDGKIYTIRNKNDTSLIYVGSTTQPLFKRFYEHKSLYKNKLKFPNIKLYAIVEDWDDWHIELYEEFPCENKEQLLKREGEVIREIGTLNCKIAGRTPKEWFDDNADKVKEYKHQYYKTNFDIIKLKAEIGRAHV